ncbi:hypothetical protein BG011_003751, partial [Mortierella polycephala]
MDLFHRFGFSISGLPDPDISPERLPEPIPDEKPTLKPIVTPAMEKTVEFIAEKNAFMHKIRPLMVINGNIPPTSFCPVPEMKVFLPVPK